MTAPAMPTDAHLPTSTTTPPTLTRTHTSNGVVGLTHLATLTPSQLATFEHELIAHCRGWISGSSDPECVPSDVMLRDWLRGYGFFASMSSRKHRQRAQVADGRPLAERAAGMLAASWLYEWKDHVNRLVVFWTVVVELLEVRGLSGVV